MMANRQTRSLDDFSTRDIDRNHDWVNESLLRYRERVESIAPLRIIVMGTDENNMVVAPTGVAAFNVEGSTIHSSLSVPICG
ncbi:hypothetical protein RhiirA1_429270 [Rhizophagus irregularis]|uniref:Uncharacterized protein n=1 Tax=Rhizophagus irregularis TaxID=588596 RepID=A0A2N0QYL2_9GLOM|nr:hypothetical protein RhiirA1_429270 [Rhizophagus irregularis]